MPNELRRNSQEMPNQLRQKPKLKKQPRNQFQKLLKQLLLNLRAVILRQNVKRVLKPKLKNELKAAIKSAITIKDTTIVLIVTDKRMPKIIANNAIAILKIIIEEINSVIITKEINETIAIKQQNHVSISRHVQLH